MVPGACAGTSRPSDFGSATVPQNAGTFNCYIQSVAAFLAGYLQDGEDVGMSSVAGDDHGAAHVCPPTVRYVCVLLAIQGSLWAFVSLAALAVCADRTNWQHAADRGSAQLAWYVAASIGMVIAAAGMSAASVLLAMRLERGRNKARGATVGLESAMTCFGVLVAYYTASAGAGIIAVLPVMAGLIGSSLSLVAVLVLLGRKARAFTRLARRNATA